MLPVNTRLLFDLVYSLLVTHYPGENLAGACAGMFNDFFLCYPFVFVASQSLSGQQPNFRQDNV